MGGRLRRVTESSDDDGTKRQRGAESSDDERDQRSPFQMEGVRGRRIATRDQVVRRRPELTQNATRGRERRHLRAKRL